MASRRAFLASKLFFSLRSFAASISSWLWRFIPLIRIIGIVRAYCSCAKVGTASLRTFRASNLFFSIRRCAAVISFWLKRLAFRRGTRRIGIVNFLSW